MKLCVSIGFNPNLRLKKVVNRFSLPFESNEEMKHLNQQIYQINVHLTRQCMIA